MISEEKIRLSDNNGRERDSGVKRGPNQRRLKFRIMRRSYRILVSEASLGRVFGSVGCGFVFIVINWTYQPKHFFGARR